MRAFTTTRAIRTAVVLALAAIVLGAVHSLATGAWTLVIAAILFAGVHWTLHFEARLARFRDRAWTIWLLLPSGGAIAATFLARETWQIWAVVALAAVALPTIAVHAMFMGQRDKPEYLGGTGTAPTGPMRAIIGWLPLVTTNAVLLVLVAAGAVDLVV